MKKWLCAWNSVFGAVLTFIHSVVSFDERGLTSFGKSQIPTAPLGTSCECMGVELQQGNNGEFPVL